MNMSDDVTGVTLQIVQKGADVAAHAAKEFIDLLTRLFAELGREHERKKANAASSPASSKSEKPSVSSTDLTDIKTGKVDLKKLRENARAIGNAGGVGVELDDIALFTLASVTLQTLIYLVSPHTT